ncbi:hypothetical protein HPB52_025015 [Rhipicephalus sanguineus]|uniref:Uncharacterized protein n=1 Tax=Rhipicephalus sanguineus TaxID=34632 RepID=A0A9D4TDJ8_RHISA|nr:hypothetical protein HPB52_025015 [Rhipicephalus sanguineus]
MDGTAALAPFPKPPSRPLIGQSGRAPGEPPVSRFPLADAAKVACDFFFPVCCLSAAGSRLARVSVCSSLVLRDRRNDFPSFADMTGDARLKKKTRQAYGKKRRRPGNAPQKKADNVRVRPSSPDAAEVMHSDDGAQPRAPVVSETVHLSGAQLQHLLGLLRRRIIWHFQQHPRPH